MDCEKFESLLIDELYGELDEVTSAAVRRHAAGCARCGALLSGLRATRKVAALPVEEPSIDLEDRILSAVREQQKVLPFRARLATAVSRAGAWAMRPQTAMAAVFLVVIGTSFVLVQGQKSKSAASYARAQFNSEGAPVQAGAAAATPTAMASAYAFDERETAFAHGVEEKRDLPRPAATATTATAEALAADLDNTKDKSRDDLSGNRGGDAVKKEALALNAGPIGGVDQAPGASNEQQLTRSATGGAGGGGVVTTPPMAQAQTQQPYAPGDPNAALAAARAEKARNGCGSAVAMFEALRGRAPVGNEATLEAARCYRTLGNSDAARSRYASLANTPYATTAQTELDAMNPAAVAARKAAPVQPSQAHAQPTATTAPQAKPAQKATDSSSY